MRLRHLLVGTATLLEIYHVQGHCIDIHSRIVSQGLHYVPGGTNPCTLCICDKGGPKWCKSVLCSPPQNCKSFQVGSSCCEFKCLDDILSSHDNYKDTYDVALRFIATTVTAVLSISLLFFLYNRLKRNKSLQHHNHQHEEQRNLSNVGYIAGNFGYNQHNMGYLGAGNNEIEIRYEETSTNFSLWKPPGNYFPPGEAPPPYEEAMRSVQNDISHNVHNATSHNTLINSITSAYPQEITPAFIQCRHEESTSSSAGNGGGGTVVNSSNTEIPNISSNTHQYVNVRVQVQHPHQTAGEHKKQERNLTGNGSCSTQQYQHAKPEARYENINALKNYVSTSAGVSSSSGERYERERDRDHGRATSSGLSKASYHKNRSRSHVPTSEAKSTTSSVMTSSSLTSALTAASSSSMADTYELVPHIPHLLGSSPPGGNPISTSVVGGGAHTSSAYNRYVNDTYNKLKFGEYSHSRGGHDVAGDAKKSMHRTLPKNLRELLSNPEGLKMGTFSSQQLHHQTERPLLGEVKMVTPKVTFSSSTGSSIAAKVDKLAAVAMAKHVPPPQVVVQPATTIVPVAPPEIPKVGGSTSNDKVKEAPVKSLLTYQSLSQDEEDYRSECENCKTANASADDDGEAMNETMSLQRRPLSESGYELSYRTSLTLPTHSRKQRTYPCTSNTREKWFTSMQQTSSEESD